MSECIKVAVRCRPLKPDERKDNRPVAAVISEDKNEIFLHDPKKKKRKKQFTFDYTYGPNSRQETIYRMCAYRIVESVLEGYNGTIFAYGQTGTGKTYTMEGLRDCPEKKGVIPRTFDQIFGTIEGTGGQKDYLVSISMLELYNEDIYDLLAPGPKSKLSLREHPGRGFFVKDLGTRDIKSAKECMAVLTAGSSNRTKGSTNMNKDSSRSHSIFSITIETSEKTDHENVLIRKGKLNLVDLAGSERQSKTKVKGKLFEEAKKINLSLVSLGKVIKALVHKVSHVPYRDSKLTRFAHFYYPDQDYCQSQ